MSLIERGRVVRGLVFALVLGAVFLTVSGVSVANPIRSKVYDVSIRKWASVYTPEYPWYWNKAQLIAESNLQPNAKSPVGAMGLGQFMPDTWVQMRRELGFKANATAYTAPLSIQAHAYYMRQLRNQFKKPRPQWDKHSLALASYNAGLGNILKAQRECGNTLLYKPMSKCLYKITGHHHKETLGYVQRIWLYTKQLEELE